jgi:hypothetical protein
MIVLPKNVLYLPCPYGRPAQQRKPDISPYLQFIPFKRHLAGIGLSVFRVIDFPVLPNVTAAIFEPGQYIESHEFTTFDCVILLF